MSKLAFTTSGAEPPPAASTINLQRRFAMRAQFAFRTPSAVILTAPTDIGHLAVACASGCLAAVSMGHDSGPSAAARVARILDEPLEAADRRRGEQRADMELARDVLARLGKYVDRQPADFD